MDAGQDSMDPREREQKQRNDEKPGALHDADVQLAVVGKGPGAEAHAASLEPAVHDSGKDRPAETERLMSVQRDGKGRGPGQKQLPDPCGDVGQLAQPQPVQKLLDRGTEGRVADSRVVAAAAADGKMQRLFPKPCPAQIDAAEIGRVQNVPDRRYAR